MSGGDGPALLSYHLVHHEAVYIGLMPHWAKIMEQHMMMCVWVKDWSSAAVFQYLFQIIEHGSPRFLPRWHIFLDNATEVPNCFQWPNRPPFGTIGQ